MTIKKEACFRKNSNPSWSGETVCETAMYVSDQYYEGICRKCPGNKTIRQAAGKE